LSEAQALYDAKGDLVSGNLWRSRLAELVKSA
jgi:hypothetical protein